MLIISVTQGGCSSKAYQPHIDACAGNYCFRHLEALGLEFPLIYVVWRLLRLLEPQCSSRASRQHATALLSCVSFSVFSMTNMPIIRPFFSSRLLTSSGCPSAGRLGSFWVLPGYFHSDSIGGGSLTSDTSALPQSRRCELAGINCRNSTSSAGMMWLAWPIRRNIDIWMPHTRPRLLVTDTYATT
ncbi:hypothetical protein DL93DRAFT_1670875 [Clavulina sp. PMI_390]|nr:hypothetical protein DL93DRAFT_1670875 [Clavulina sp. PMI_390]